MGIIMVWFTASACMALYISLLVVLCFDIDEAEFTFHCQAREVLLVSYLAQMLDYYVALSISNISQH